MNAITAIAVIPSLARTPQAAALRRQISRRAPGPSRDETEGEGREYGAAHTGARLAPSPLNAAKWRLPSPVRDYPGRWSGNKLKSLVPR